MMITFFTKFGPVLLLLTLPLPAFAYLGPGGGITAIGALIAIVLAVLYTFFGFIWFPLKRLFKKIRGKQQPIEPVATTIAVADKPNKQGDKPDKQDKPDSKIARWRVIDYLLAILSLGLILSLMHYFKLVFYCKGALRLAAQSNAALFSHALSDLEK